MQNPTHAEGGRPTRLGERAPEVPLQARRRFLVGPRRARVVPQRHQGEVVDVDPHLQARRSVTHARVSRCPAAFARPAHAGQRRGTARESDGAVAASAGLCGSLRARVVASWFAAAQRSATPAASTLRTPSPAPASRACHVPCCAACTASCPPTATSARAASRAGPAAAAAPAARPAAGCLPAAAASAAGTAKRSQSAARGGARAASPPRGPAPPAQIDARRNDRLTCSVAGLLRRRRCGGRCTAAADACGTQRSAFGRGGGGGHW